VRLRVRRAPRHGRGRAAAQRARLRANRRCGDASCMRERFLCVSRTDAPKHRPAAPSGAQSTMRLPRGGPYVHGYTESERRQDASEGSAESAHRDAAVRFASPGLAFDAPMRETCASARASRGNVLRRPCSGCTGRAGELGFRPSGANVGWRRVRARTKGRRGRNVGCAARTACAASPSALLQRLGTCRGGSARPGASASPELPAVARDVRT
jgi:hypothetical protein